MMLNVKRKMGVRRKTVAQLLKPVVQQMRQASALTVMHFGATFLDL
jgi:hypothetical protein